MRDEEVRKIRKDMLSKKEISPIRNSSTEQFNRKPPHNDAMNDFFLIWMIDAAHRSNGYLTRKQIGNMKMNSVLLPNEDSFQGTMA